MVEIFLNQNTDCPPHKEALEGACVHAERFWQEAHVKGGEKKVREQRVSEALLARLGASSEEKIHCFHSPLEACRSLYLFHYLYHVKNTGKAHIGVATSWKEGSDQTKEILSLLGCTEKTILLNSEGVLTQERLEKEINPRVSLLSISLERGGVLQPIEEISAFCRSRSIFLHVDVGTCIGKIPIQFTDWQVDFLTGEGKRCGAPFVGSFLIRKEGFSWPLDPPSLPLLVSLSNALGSEIDEMDTIQLAVATKRSYFEKELVRRCPKAHLLFAESLRLPHSFLFSFPGIHQSSLLFFLRQQGLHLDEIPMKELERLQIEPLLAQGAIGVSLSLKTTDEEIERALFLIQEGYDYLMRAHFVPKLQQGSKEEIISISLPSKKAHTLFYQIRHAGTFSDEEGSSKGMRVVQGEAGGLLQGRGIAFSLLVDETDGVIADVKFRAYGPPLLFALGEATSLFLIRKNVGQMGKITAELLEKQLQDPSFLKLKKEEGGFLNVVIEAISVLEESCADLQERYFPPSTPLSPSSEGIKRYPGWELLSEIEKLRVIEEVIAEDIRPYVEMDNGGVRVLGINESEVIIGYEGACTTCYAATGSTLHAIQMILREKVSEDLIVRPDTSLFH